MHIKGTSVFTESDGLVKRDFYIQNDRLAEDSDDGCVIEADNLIAVPGLIDIHFHGAVGCDTCDASENSLHKICKYEAASGILAVCPATMTYKEDYLSKIMETVSDFTSADGEADLVGINMEGPFINGNKAGAQNREYIMLPDANVFRDLQRKSGNRIKLLDVAPELPGAMEMISELKNEVKISIAHTEADYDTAVNAFKAGASHITHLYNAMNGISHRAPGPVIASLENKAETELICDGVHVDPAVIRFTFNLFDDDKLILISDSMRACGLPDGIYDLGGQNVKVSGNKAVLTSDNKTIAGSVTNLYSCMVNAVKFGVKPFKAIKAATLNPAVSIGIDKDYGSLETGRRANILLVDKDWNIRKIIKDGKLIKNS